MQINVVRILYCLYPDTGTLREGCPSLDHRMLDVWPQRLRDFVRDWEGLSSIDQRADLAAAIDMMDRRGVRELAFPRPYVMGVDRDPWWPVARASEALPRPSLKRTAPGYRTVLLMRPAGLTLTGQPVLWWADEGTVTWVPAHAFDRPL